MVRWDYTDLSNTAAGDSDALWLEAATTSPRAQRAPGDELLGMMFTQPKELRHLAEQLFGLLFVPTRVITQQRHSVVVALDHPEAGELVVHAERARHWYPYRVTRVERAGDRA